MASAALGLNADGWRHTQAVMVPQGGLVRVELPASTLDAAESDLADLRVLDPGGSEVGYLIERPMPKAETTARPVVFQSAINADATMTVTLRTGSVGRIGGVRLETPASHFIKGVTVESSTDGVIWSEVADSRPIFRVPGGAENLRVDFPEAVYAWLRFTLDDRRDEPIPFNGAVLISPSSEEAPSEAVAITVQSQDESPGTTRIAVDLGAANLAIATLEIETKSPLFTRSVTVAEPEMQDGAVSEQPVGEAVLYRVDLGGRNEERLGIPLERQIKTRELVLLIHNQDSAPLAIDGVSGRRREVRALFYATGPGRYTLLTGNRQCGAPSYDLAGMREQLGSAAATPAEVGALAENPTYHAAEALDSLALQGAAIDPAKWKFRKVLPVGNRGAQQVELDEDVLARAAADFSDVRIVQGEHQIPYVLEHPSISRPVPLLGTNKRDAEHPSVSRWELKLPQPGLPIDRLTCVGSSPLFARTMRLWEEVADERGDTYTRELGHADWHRTPGEPQHSLVVELDTAPQSGVLFLETDNGDNGAVELGSFQGSYAVTRAVFKAGGEAGQPVWLCYGNAEAGPPAYDLRLVAEDLLRAEREVVTAGRQEGEDGGTGNTPEVLTGASRYLFWGALILVVLGLLAVTAKLLPKSGDANDVPPPRGDP